jgi:hypothetical protein
VSAWDLLSWVLPPRLPFCLHATSWLSEPGHRIVIIYGLARGSQGGCGFSGRGGVGVVYEGRVRHRNYRGGILRMVPGNAVELRDL